MSPSPRPPSFGDAAPETRALVELGEAARVGDVGRHFGKRAAVLAALSRRGAPIVETWLISRKSLEVALGPVAQLRSLVRASSTAEGTERCARALEAILSAEPSREFALALEEWCAYMTARGAEELIIEPDLAGPLGPAGSPGPILRARLARCSPDEVLAAIRDALADGVTALNIARLADLGIREPAFSICIQRADANHTVLAVAKERAPTDVQARDTHWRFRVLRDAIEMATGAATFSRPLLESIEAPSVQEDLVAQRLRHEGLARLHQVLKLVEEELGSNCVVAVSVGNTAPTSIWVHRADTALAPRELSVELEPFWVELQGTGSGRRPIGELSRSLLFASAEVATRAALHGLGVASDEPRQLVRSSFGGIYLGLDAVIAATRDIPGLRSGELLSSLGTGSFDVLDRLSQQSGASKRPLRGGLRLASFVSRQLRRRAEDGRVERDLQREVRGFGELDLTLLPTDAISTSLLRVKELLVRAVELWARTSATQFAALTALSAILGRRSTESELASSALIVSGAGGTFGASMTAGLARVVDVFRVDVEARSRLEAGASSLDALPDGSARGALGQFLSSYGDVATDLFDLEVPRWSEDQGFLFGVIRRWLARDGMSRVAVEVAQERVRARADAELARHEPELGWAERSALRFLVEEGRQLARERASYDRLVHRVVALARSVALDADRRLQRIDASNREGAVFACSVERLVSAYRSGRPEVRALVSMRDREARLLDSGIELPAVFCGRIPTRPFASDIGSVARGIGVSSGVVDGVAEALDPAAMHGGHRIIKARSLEIAMIPDCFIAGGAVSESGGILSPHAEALRELGVPAVFSVGGLAAGIEERERIRIDGTKGVIFRNPSAEVGDSE